MTFVASPVTLSCRSVRGSPPLSIPIDEARYPMPTNGDPTFYRSPAAAAAAPPEKLAYVAAFDPSGEQRDAMTVIDCDAESPTYGEVVGWSELPTAGNELHHFGWNACSSALCHEGHEGVLERRY